jgi:peptide/nickel transport system permease protein/dipeptide transport system permease protein
MIFKSRIFETEAWTEFKKSRSAIAGLVIVLIAIAVAVVGDLLAPHDPLQTDLSMALLPPGRNMGYLLGTDQFGRCVLSRILSGAKLSMVVGLISVGVGLLIGTPLGLAAGYRGKIANNIIMRAMDIMLAVPGFLIALAVAAALGPSLRNVMLAVGLYHVPLYARITCGVTLSIKEKDYVEAARGLGLGDFEIVLRHILPNCLPSLMVVSTLQIPSAILTAATLGFLGLGAQPPTPEWGALLNEGRGYLSSAWWIPTFPGLAILFVVLSLNLFGDGLRDAFDPRLRI